MQRGSQCCWNIVNFIYKAETSQLHQKVSFYADILDGPREFDSATCQHVSDGQQHECRRSFSSLWLVGGSI
jgi:hypothetical protein